MDAGRDEEMIGDARKRVVGELDFFADRDNTSDHRLKGHRDQDDRETVPLLDQDQDHHHQLDVNTGLCLLTTNTCSDKSTVDESSSGNNMIMEDNKKPVLSELAVLQAELDRVNSENRHLRGMIRQANNNFHALNMQYAAIVQAKQHSQKPDQSPDQESNNRAMISALLEENQRAGGRQLIELGRASQVERESSSERRAQNPAGNSSPQNEIVESMSAISSAFRDQIGRSNKEYSDQDHEDQQDQAAGARWVPNKVARLNAGPSTSREEDQAASETMSMIRKARVSVRARSEAAMISDGCQWRKYGQKMAKGNPCPRAYYRCTMATGCPVRKQVQRCAEDQTILTTTYEGHHNHPLPPAAMAMASTTSAAASMLLSGSMPSADHLNPNFLGRTGLHCSPGFATLSASAPFPTVTLDLTRSPNPSSSPADQIITQLRHLPNPNPNPNPSLTGGEINSLHGQCSKLMGFHGNPNELGQAGQAATEAINAAATAAMANPKFTAVLVAALTNFMGGAKSGNNVAGSGVAARNNSENNA